MPLLSALPLRLPAPGFCDNAPLLPVTAFMHFRQFIPHLLGAALGALLSLGLAQAAPPVSLPRTAITANELALLINDDDPLSRQTGAYYQQQRQIPDENVIHLNFPADKVALSIHEFAPLKAEIDRLTGKHIQAYAVAWTQPYRVGCMSLTSALAFGFDDSYCSGQCGPTAPNPYFNSAATYPFDQHQLRPAMMLAGTSFEQVKALIDRGIAADHSFPEGKAYLLNTADKARNVRSAKFPLALSESAGLLPTEQIDADFLVDRKDVLFYFTGQVHVRHLDTLHFQPGALADHLTSFGGQLTNSSQMSSLRWLEAGATASYGTVTEPCNHPQKFPVPILAMLHYAMGATAIEAYWKSVFWPGEGVFIGEPLARPFAPKLRSLSNGQFELKLISPARTVWRIEHADSAMGPFLPTGKGITIPRGRSTLRFAAPPGAKAYLRLGR